MMEKRKMDAKTERADDGSVTLRIEKSMLSNPPSFVAGLNDLL
jgi:hypothetical protein